MQLYDIPRTGLQSKLSMKAHILDSTFRISRTYRPTFINNLALIIQEPIWHMAAAVNSVNSVNYIKFLTDQQ